jgi:hypothetical protein
MYNMLKVTSVAVLLAAASMPVLADDSSSASSQPSSASSSASSSQMSSSSAVTSSSSSSMEETTAKVNYGTIISAIEAGKSADLSAITASSTINFVLVSQVKANGNTTALTNALKKNASAITKLQADAAANATLKAKLDAAGYTASQVVAVIVEADGSVTVVINDQA